jgi:hypothetical protein
MSPTGKTCGICQSSVVNDEVVIMKKCKCVFHDLCIQSYQSAGGIHQCPTHKTGKGKGKSAAMGTATAASYVGEAPTSNPGGGPVPATVGQAATAVDTATADTLPLPPADSVASPAAPEGPQQVPASSPPENGPEVHTTPELEPPAASGTGTQLTDLAELGTADGAAAAADLGLVDANGCDNDDDELAEEQPGLEGDKPSLPTRPPLVP